MQAHVPQKRIGIVGSGIAGASLANALTNLGANVLVLDRRCPPHNTASHGGKARVDRDLTFEDDALGETSKRSRAIQIKAAEKVSGYLQEKFGSATVFHKTGVLFYGPTKKLAAQTHKIIDPMWSIMNYAQTNMPDVSIWDRGQISRNFKRLAVPDSVTDTIMGCFDPSGGILVPELCVAAQMEVARLQGAKFELDAEVKKVSSKGPVQTIECTNGNSFDVDEVVITAGARLQRLLEPELRSYFKPEMHLPIWFRIAQPESFSRHNHPAFVRFLGVKDGVLILFYGFPSLDGRTIKLCDEVGRVIEDLSELDNPRMYVAAKHQIDALYDKAHPHIQGLKREGAYGEGCLYMLTHDGKILIAEHPTRKGLRIVSPCNGYGFKHIPFLMEVLAHHIMGQPHQFSLAPFGWHPKTSLIEKATLNM